MTDSIFYQLSLVLAVAAAVAFLFRTFRQPLIIAYIITGFVVGPPLLNLINDQEAFESFSQIGIALLLFIIGLGLNVRTIRTTGKPVFLVFLAVMASVGVLTYGAGLLFGLSVVECLVLAIAVLFSSTIVVVKAISDKKEQSRLYAQIAIGILLVEDVLATLALVFLSSQGGGGASVDAIGLLLLKGAILATALIVLGAYVLPKFLTAVAASQELLFIFALAWAFGVASVFWWYGFSIEVGSLFAGVALAHLPYAQEISTRLKPLRDFFIVLFFVHLGQDLHIGDIGQAIVPALVLSLIVMVGKPLSILATLGVLGYTKQTGFKAAVHLSQISEFSIIFVVLAASTGLVSHSLATIITLTAIITIICSAYLMKYDERLFRLWNRRLSVFERSQTKREVKTLHSYPLVLLGYRNGGYEFVRTFRQIGKQYIVIDFDPDVIETLEHQHINHIYGDVTDLELLEELSLHRSELVVSDIGDFEANLLLVRHITSRNKDAIFVCHASSYDEAAKLYDKGASYVLLPHVIGSEKVNSFIRRNGSDKGAFDEYRDKHIAALESV